MRSYKLSAKSYRDYNTSRLINDDDIFVAICPHSWIKPKPFAIQLFSGVNTKRMIYRVSIGPSNSLTSRTIAFGQDPLESGDSYDVISREDGNTVVRIVKTGENFNTYVNGHYIRPTRTAGIARAEDRTVTGASFNIWDLQVSASETLLMYGFDSSSGPIDLVKSLAHQMKNPVKSFWALLLAMEEEEEADQGEGTPTDGLLYITKSSDNRWIILPTAGKRLARSFLEKARLLKKRGRWLAKVDDAENNAGIGIGTGGDGADVPSISTSVQSPYSNSARGLDINPPDAEYIKLSATIAWPRAVKHILGATRFDSIQKHHEQLMRSWVVSRGDNISDKAYDYLMYSQWVGWPKVVLEASSAEKLARVRARCEEVMKVLV